MKKFKNGNLITMGKVFTFIMAISSFVLAYGNFYKGAGSDTEIIILKWIAVMSSFLLIMQIIAYFSISYIVSNDSFTVKIGSSDRKISYDDIVSIELFKKGIKLKLKKELGIVNFNTNNSKELFNDLSSRLRQRKIEQQNKTQNQQKKSQPIGKVEKIEKKEKMQLHAVLPKKK